jgi:rare lipoprotein A
MTARWFVFLLVVSAAACGPVYRGYQTKPYTIRGIRYYPMQPREALGFRERGIASWYNEHKFLWFGGKTSLGEPFKARALAGAHKTLPLPCRVRVRNLQNGKTVVVRLNDRGPFIEGRIIDLTPAAARRLGFEGRGLAPVEIEVLSVGDSQWRIR